MAADLYLSFDLSTQTLKALGADNCLQVVKECVINFDKDLPEFCTDGGVHKKDLEATSPILMWTKAVDRVLGKLKDAEFDFSRVKGISGTGQQHGSVYWKAGTLQIMGNLDSKRTLEEQLKVKITTGTTFRPKKAHFSYFKRNGGILKQNLLIEKISASLHFSGHTFNVYSCLNVARNIDDDGNCISTEIKVYQL